MQTDERMSDYERQAWQRLIDEARTTADDGEPGRWRSGLARVRSQTAAQAARARDAAMSLPHAEQVSDVVGAAVEKALTGLHSMTVDFGLNSVNERRIIRHFAKRNYTITGLDEVRGLGLRACDRASSSGRQFYALAGAGEGAASSLAVTGLTVASTVSGGTTAAAAAAAIAADSVAVLTGMGRIIADVAAHYGYDVTEPEEAVFAAGVLSYSTARGSREKVAALGALSRLTQDMMRRTTMATLSQNQIVQVIDTVFKVLGVKMTKKKLAQAVPVAGVLINGGMNANLAHRTYYRARTAYRLRFLTDKYGLDPAQWRPDAGDTAYQGGSGIPLIDEIVDAEIVEATDSGSGG